MLLKRVAAPISLTREKSEIRNTKHETPKESKLPNLFGTFGFRTWGLFRQSIEESIEVEL